MFDSSMESGHVPAARPDPVALSLVSLTADPGQVMENAYRDAIQRAVTPEARSRALGGWVLWLLRQDRWLEVHRALGDPGDELDGPARDRLARDLLAFVRRHGSRVQAARLGRWLRRARPGSPNPEDSRE